MKLPKTNFFSPSLVIVLAVGVLLVGVNYAGATTVTYAQDTNWDAGVGTIVISANSDANEVTTTNTTMKITIASGQKMVLNSVAGLHLSNDGGYSFTCDSTGSHLTITSSSTKDVVVTPLSTGCASTGGSSSGGTSTPTPTPTPAGGGGDVPVATPAPAASATPTPTPVPAPSTSSGRATPISRGFVSLSAVNLKDGDVISAGGSSDPDVYIVNPHGYKRLFLNPAIFGFYGHLGGFSKVKSAISTTVRDTFVTSGLFRNCETNDKKVYGVEVTGEDTGMLHWVNTTGEQAVADDANFFKKVFCINTNEFSWYKKGSDYTSVNQIPDYARGKVLSPISSISPTPAPASTVKKYKVVSSVGYLNVRSSASTSSSILGQLTAGTIIESLSKSGLWHKIKYQNKDAWVHGDYLQAM